MLNSITEQEKLLNESKKFLKLNEYVIHSDELLEQLKELCVARLCKSVGIRCDYNYKSPFFEFFSAITAEALCEKLGFLFHVASDDLRLVKYEGVNLIQGVKKCLEQEDVDEAFIDAFNFVDNHKYLMTYIKKLSAS